MIQILAVLLPLIYIFSSYRSWQCHVALAKKSGVTYLSAPILFGNGLWMVGHMIIMPIFKCLPKSWKEPWIHFMEVNWPYTKSFTPFERHDTDVIMVASPGGVYMNCANADAITQMAARRNDFQKPVDVYGLVNIFGENVVTTEGHTWREHRKITAPAFSERTNALVWKESLNQTKAMLTMWSRLGENSPEDMAVRNIHPDLGSLTLHVISGAGFGIKMFWPWQKATLSDDSSMAKFSSHTVPDGHTMTFRDALDTVLHNILWFAVFSPETLGRLPFTKPRKIWEGWDQCMKYWKELLKQKIQDIQAGESEKDSMDLLAPLVRAARIADIDRGTNNDEELPRPEITATEVIGNAFIFILAGHESSADSITFSIICLALNRSAQRRLQGDLDEIIQGKPSEEWDYTKHYDKLYNSMLGAVINEQLRLLPPVIVIPKTVKTGDQPLNIDGRKVVIPNGTFVHFNAIGVQRNPRYWPHSPSKRTGKPNDLEDFIPERWLLNNKTPNVPPQGVVDDEESTPSSAPRASNLYTPPRGAFLPFSDGQRACIGRRFALAEITATIALLFKSYSVELAVDDWASDEEVARMTDQEKEAVYQKAIDRAYGFLDQGCHSILTLKLKSGNEIPLRFVRRGKERFVG